MATGTVRNFDAVRGAGFIAADDGADDVFVNAAANERGPRAVNLSAVED